MNLLTPKDGEPCGEKVAKGNRNISCKFHFGVEHFTSISEMKRLVQPDPRDGRIPPETYTPGEIGFSILRYSLDGSPARGEYPADDPIVFKRDPRIYAPTGKLHYGWLPIWGNGLDWPYWSYQHGFGGDYYGRVLKSAMRFEIYDQIEDARYGMGEGMHVHHEAPNTFAVLSSAWMGINSLFAKDIELTEPHPSFKAFADRELAASWQDFHAENATLIIMTPEEHRAAHAAGVK